MSKCRRALELMRISTAKQQVVNSLSTEFRHTRLCTFFFFFVVVVVVDEMVFSRTVTVLSR